MSNHTWPSPVAIAFAIVASISLSAVAANASPLSEANAVNKAFTERFAACDVPGLLALYEDNAVLVWPAQGDMAVGKAAIAKVLKANCSGPSKQSVTPISSHARAVGKNYILHYGELESTVTGKNGKPIKMRIRDTELMHRSDGKWRFVVDHASVGIPPP